MLSIKYFGEINSLISQIIRQINLYSRSRLNWIWTKLKKIFWKLPAKYNKMEWNYLENGMLLEQANVKLVHYTISIRNNNANDALFTIPMLK